MAENTETCACCGAGPAFERTRVVEIQPLGRVTEYRRREWRCKDCRKAYTDEKQGEFNERESLAAKASALRVVGGAELRKLRDIAGVTQSELEALLGLGTNTIARWETGQRPLPPYIATLVRLCALHPTSIKELAAIVRELPVEASEARAQINYPLRQPPILQAAEPVHEAGSDLSIDEGGPTPAPPTPVPYGKPGRRGPKKKKI